MLVAIVLSMGQAPSKKALHDQEKLEATLPEIKKDYERAEANAKKAFLKSFDVLISRVKLSKENAEIKAGLIGKLEKEKIAFEKYNTLPESNEMWESMFRYLNDLNTARRKLRVTYEKLMNLYIKSDSKEKLKTIVAEKEAIDDRLPGRGLFTQDKLWKGTRSSPDGNNVEFRIKFIKFTGPKFETKISMDRGNAEVLMNGVGNIEGNLISINTTAVTRGANRQFHLEGFLLSDKIILNLTGTAPNGQPVYGLVILTQ